MFKLYKTSLESFNTIFYETLSSAEYAYMIHTLVKITQQDYIETQSDKPGKPIYNLTLGERKYRVSVFDPQLITEPLRI